MPSCCSFGNARLGLSSGSDMSSGRGGKDSPRRAKEMKGLPSMGLGSGRDLWNICFWGIHMGLSANSVPPNPTNGVRFSHCLSVCLSLPVSACLCLSLSVSVCLCLSVCHSYLSIHQIQPYLFIYPSICPVWTPELKPSLRRMAKSTVARANFCQASAKRRMAGHSHLKQRRPVRLPQR